MTRKNYLTITILTIFTITAFSAPAMAGSPQRHRWEGLAIGLGAAILGKAIFDSHNQSYRRPTPEPAVVEHHHYYQEPQPEPAGHWETRKQWVAPRHKKVWNPGHYNRHGHWVSGHWIRVETEPGHWVEQQVWVPHY